MRIPIRAQLTVLVLFTTLVALAIVAIATWVTQRKFTLDLRTTRLSLTASLKAAQVASQLDLLLSSVESLATRVRLQQSLVAYNNGTNATDDWRGSYRDMYTALSDASSQSVYTTEAIALPLNPILGPQYATILEHVNHYNYEDPTTSALVPDLVYASNDNKTSDVSYNGQPLGGKSTILLGPQIVNGSGLLSITTGVTNNNDTTQFLGFVTVVMSTRGISDVLNSPVGLDRTGVGLLLGPIGNGNLFPRGFLYSDPPPAKPNEIRDTQVHYMFPPNETYTKKRHKAHSAGQSFSLAAYPAAGAALTKDQHSANNAGSMIATKDEGRSNVAVGYALPPSALCDWVLMVEQAQSEVYEPLDRLRRILLGCIFGTALGMVLLIIPLATVAVKPIEKLRDATLRTVSLSRQHSTASSEEKLGLHSPGESADEKPRGKFMAFITKAMFWRRSNPGIIKPRSRRKVFRLPKKVHAGLKLIKDELTDLLDNFNLMTDELHTHWLRLEDRVQQRTEELEVSKKAAEAANESKTLFIANVSHELKTPLAGILGMCALSAQEANEPLKIKHSMEIALKSGELLNNLLNDLLQFSKSSGKHQIELDEREFRFREIKSQLRSIFENQAKQREIRFRIEYDQENSVAGPFNDMTLFGDQQRLLQILINLVSNSLKFTPKDGVVRLKIRCLPFPYLHTETKRDSSQSLKIGKSVRIAPPERRKSNSDPSPAPPISDQRPDLASRHASSSPVRQITDTSQEFVFEFEVEDTGPGIEPKLQETIFLPFVQGDLRLTKKFGGTGLGLSICRQLASLMRGNITLESHVSVGSKFTFRVPLRLIETRRASVASSFQDWSMIPSRKDSSAQAIPNGLDLPPPARIPPEQEAMTIDSPKSSRLVGLSAPFFTSKTPPLASPSDDNTSGKRVRVLVAEDNYVNQEVVLRMLRLEDIFDVVVAKDGQEALDVVQESMTVGQPFDLILMDVQMPIMDGRESTQRIRQIGYQAPIVALSAFSDETNQEACLASGMNSFLGKPIKRPALKNVLKTYCSTIKEEDDPLASKGAAIGVSEVEVASDPVKRGRSGTKEDTPRGPKDELR